MAPRIELPGSASPFPGMDPFLEGDLWFGFRRELTVEIRRQLILKLPPQYLPYPAFYRLEEIDERIQKWFRFTYHGISIRDMETKKLITMIEVLSAAHKTGPGRKQFRRRRNMLLRAPVNLVEIDFVHHGRSFSRNPSAPRTPYSVIVSRHEERPVAARWPLKVSDPLPILPIPLRNGEPEVVFDLSEAFGRTFELGHYDAIMNYTSSCPAPLRPKEAAWVDRRLKSMNLR